MEPTRHIRALAFDFDGTLARFRGDFYDFFDSYRASLGLMQCDMNRYAELLLRELRQDGVSSLHGAVRRALAALELREPDDLADVTAAAVREYAEQVEVLPGAVELLTWAHARVPLALLTNGPVDLQRAAVHHTGLARYFRTILISGDPDLAARKPAARIFRLACVGLERLPEETLMIGDDLEADILGARAYGLEALWLGGTPGEGYDAVVDLAEVRAWLEPRLLT